MTRPPTGPIPTAIEKAERVATALAELPDHYEAVLRAKYLDRLTVEAIATRPRRHPEGGGIAACPRPAGVPRSVRERQP